MPCDKELGLFLWGNMRRFIDLDGKTFGKLTVICLAPRKKTNKEMMWICKCSCNNQTTIETRGSLLRSRRKTNCGCIWKTNNKILIDKIIHKFSINGKLQNNCLEWMGLVDKKGFGRLSLTDHGAKNQKVHEIAWKVYESKIPKGYRVIQKCQNKRCFRIDHLSLVKIE